MDTTPKSGQPLVAIRCITYNHEPYIRDALEGFVMQKTDFPFVAIVHDDASTDGTAAVIREYAEKYPDIIKPIYETENQYSKRDGSLSRIMNAACEATGAKYIAMCEGDDYWTDPLKLQKQVDFLESHPDYTMVYGKARIVNEFSNSNIILGREYKSLNDLLSEKYMIPTASILFRANIIDTDYWQIKDENGQWKMGDLPLSLYLASKGHIFMLDSVLTVYRILKSSASHFEDWERHISFINSAYEVKYYFAHYNNIEDAIYKRIRHNHKLEISRSLTIYGKYKELKNLYNTRTQFLDIKTILYYILSKNKVFFKLFQCLLKKR